jgi:hypothetical protein
MEEMLVEVLSIFKDITLHGAGDGDIINQTVYRASGK